MPVPVVRHCIDQQNVTQAAKANRAAPTPAVRAGAQSGRTSPEDADVCAGALLPVGEPIAPDPEGSVPLMLLFGAPTTVPSTVNALMYGISK